MHSVKLGNAHPFARVNPVTLAFRGATELRCDTDAAGVRVDRGDCVSLERAQPTPREEVHLLMTSSSNVRIIRVDRRLIAPRTLVAGSVALLAMTTAIRAEATYLVTQVAGAEAWRGVVASRSGRDL